MKRRRKNKEVQAPSSTEKYTVERFFGGVGDKVATSITLDALDSGYQLVTNAIPTQVLPAMLILAAYSRHFVDVELVDDYEKLIELHNEYIKEFAHPDKYLASCICILHEREQFPSYEAFEAVQVPRLFSEMTNIED